MRSDFGFARAQDLLQIVQRQAGIDDVLDDDDVAALEAGVEVLDEPHFARRRRAPAVARERDEVDGDAPSIARTRSDEKQEGALEDADEMDVLAGEVGADLVRQFCDARCEGFCDEMSGATRSQTDIGERAYHRRPSHETVRHHHGSRRADADVGSTVTLAPGGHDHAARGRHAAARGASLSCATSPTPRRSTLAPVADIRKRRARQRSFRACAQNGAARPPARRGDSRSRTSARTHRRRGLSRHRRPGCAPGRAARKWMRAS